ncbi:helix-turn-helix transcriptional regulator [Streptomyces sp. NBC_00878]|uniref:helix-turn-helix domain-containing protein n=1 Tax=Streptomyces sp. NBC_00878 TaxID=2975854 RepID=UPI00338F2554
MSVALVGSHGAGSICLSWPEARVVRDLHEVRSGDDVLLSCGPGMAQEVRRFSIESDVKLLPTCCWTAAVSTQPNPVVRGRRKRTVRLSHREKRIMALLASGLVTREVALNMCLTENTVRNYLSGICRKRQVRSYGRPHHSGR